MFDIRQQHLTTSDLLTLMDSRFWDFFPEVWLRTNSQAATGRISNRIAVPIPLPLMHAIEWEPGHRYGSGSVVNLATSRPHLGHFCPLVHHVTIMAEYIDNRLHLKWNKNGRLKLFCLNPGILSFKTSAPTCPNTRGSTSTGRYGGDDGHA